VFIIRSERSYREWLEGRGASNWIGWQRRDVFKYDEKKLKTLERLYRSGDRKGLAREWQKCCAWSEK